LELFCSFWLFVLIYSTNKNVWLNIFKVEKIQKEDAPQNPIGVQIESVVSLLILDFIKEREFNREERKEQSKENKGGHHNE
jgi:hypothetical protein